MEVRSDVETSNRPCGRISRSLAFAAMRKGEARMRRSKGPKPLRRTPLSDSPARRETPTVSNPSNRRIRTRMYGGVGGEESRDSPLSRSLTRLGHLAVAGQRFTSEAGDHSPGSLTRPRVSQFV